MANEQAPRDENQVTAVLLTDDTTGETVAWPCDANGNAYVIGSIEGGITGPGSSTDNAIVRWDGTAGNTVQNSGVVIDDANNVTGVNTLNRVTITAPAASATLTIANGKTLTVSNTITFDGTDGTTMTFPNASGTVVTLDATQTLTNKTLTSPTLTTPSLGVATATSINKVAITAPASAATLTLADGSTLATSGANSITLTSTGATNVTLPTSGTLVNTAVTTLSSLASVGTITTGVWNGTDIAVADGGTGVSSLTAYAVICGGTTSTGAVQSVASVGTSGQVLTSNGAGALPTFQDAAAGGGGGWAISITDDQATDSGTVTMTKAAPTYDATVSSSGAISIKYLSFNATPVEDLWDRNPKGACLIRYTGGSSTGDGRVWFGLADGTTPTRTWTTKSALFFIETVSGTSTLYAVTSNGTTNENTSISGVTLTSNNVYEVFVTSGVSALFYVNGVLKATHTTYIPSGSMANSAATYGIANETGDATARSARFGFPQLVLPLSA